MRIIVSDSSSLIDIRKGRLLRAFLNLPYELVVPDAMINDELLSFSKGEVSLMRRKMTVANLGSDDMSAVHAAQRDTSALTLYDSMALVIAESAEDAILLTGDRRLRAVAEAAHIRCHGVLWVVEELMNLDLASRTELIDALKAWKEDSLVRLPPNEIERLVNRVRRR